MDTRIKVGLPPVDEYDGHNLPINVLTTSLENNLILSGG